MPAALDRLVRKEVSLGSIRERPRPADQVGINQIAPFLPVATDDVIFDYIKGGLSQDSLAPARAEDAESELAQKDDLGGMGQGRASVIDWALKDRYATSDVTRWREDLLLRQAAGTLGLDLPLSFNGSTQQDFQARLARDDARRRRTLDNRLEWLIMTALETNSVSYNDGKIKFTVNYTRPADQQNQAPHSGLLFSDPHCDPIGDILFISDLMYERYGIRPKRAYCSNKILNSFWKSDRFLASAGVPVVVGGTTTNVPLDPNYLGLQGYTPQGAKAIVEAATGIQFVPYDAVYRSRPLGSSTVTNVRFMSENKIVFLPDGTDSQEDGVGFMDDTQIGFAKTLTSPHVEGNWSSGFYEWETPAKQDPWEYVRGSGIKAFPVFPYMEYSYVMTAL